MQMTPRPKTPRIKDEAYRRRVAALPCIACGVHGYSQAAHPPAPGRGIKQSDRLCVPLCCARPGNPGIVGCHIEADQSIMASREEMKNKFARWVEIVQKELDVARN